MLEGSPRRQELEQRIRQSRVGSVDGRSVVYNLTRGVDFSHPRATAEAVAQVVWDQDVHAWWKVENGAPSCTPTGTVEIWIPREPNRKIAKAVDEFKEDLKNHELADHFSGYLNQASDYQVGWGTVFLMGPLWAYLIENSEIKQRRREATEQLFSQMARCIKVLPQ